MWLSLDNGHFITGNKNFTKQNLPCVSDKDKIRLNKYILKTGDIVFSRVGSVDRCSYVSKSYDGWMFSGRCLRVRPGKMLNAEYLYYFFLLDSTKQFVRNIATGATMPSINTKFMGEVPVVVPPLTVQEKIVDVLRNLDDKIQLNTEINKNLEEQARALMMDYCGRVYNTAPLGTVMSFINGFAFKSSTYLSSGKYKIITIKNVQDGQIETQGTPYIDTIPTQMKPECSLQIGDVLLSLTGNVGRVGIVCEENLLLNQRVAKIQPIDRKILPFLYFYYRLPETKARLETIAKGTAQANLSPIETLKLEFPFNQVLMNALSCLLSRMFLIIQNNQIQNLVLAETRNALLPHLMSGEIDVSNIDL